MVREVGGEPRGRCMQTRGDSSSRSQQAAVQVLQESAERTRMLTETGNKKAVKDLG